MSSFAIKDFKPTILFLAKFLGLYLVLNLVYGYFVEREYPQCDAATAWVTDQTSGILNGLGWENFVSMHNKKPTTSIIHANRAVVSVYEGCNGINVAIIFICFLVAFGPINRKLAWYAPLGLVIIHVFNVGRILGLFWVVLYLPGAVYFTHKYVFTAVIYAVIFLLWLVWIRMTYIKKA